MAEAVPGGRRSAHNERWESARTHSPGRPSLRAASAWRVTHAHSGGAPLDGASKSMAARAL